MRSNKGTTSESAHIIRPHIVCAAKEISYLRCVELKNNLRHHHNGLAQYGGNFGQCSGCKTMRARNQRKISASFVPVYNTT